MITVKATREGLEGKTTASGYIVDSIVPFVALPSVHALRRFVRITNPLNGRHCLAIVLDVGPWNENDNHYVFGNARPLSELGTDTRGRTTNMAGIDLGGAVWRALDMKTNSNVTWEFIY